MLGGIAMHLPLVHARSNKLRGAGTWEDVGCVKLGSVFHAVNPERGAVNPIWVAFMRTPSIPLHLPELFWNPHVYTNPWQ